MSVHAQGVLVQDGVAEQIASSKLLAAPDCWIVCLPNSKLILYGWTFGECWGCVLFWKTACKRKLKTQNALNVVGTTTRKLT